MRHLTRVLLFSVLFGSSALPVSAQPAPPAVHPILGGQPVVHRLPNGLTVVTIETNSPGILAYYTLVNVGSRDEVEAGHSGFAHLFEHMMFRGTRAMPGEEYEAATQALGTDNNAYTTQDFTLYTLTGPSQGFGEMVRIEAERFQRLWYSEDGYRTESGAVLGEYAKNASNPGRQIWEALSEMAFTRHTYGHTTLGYLRDVCQMPNEYAYSQQFFRRFYTPDNTVIVLAGDVPDDALAQITSAYGRWRGRRHRSRVQQEPPLAAPARRHLVWDAPIAPMLAMAYRTPAFVGNARDGRAADRAQALRQTAALEVVKRLAFSSAAPLYQQLVVDQRKLNALDPSVDEFTRDAGLFVITAELAEGTTHDETIAAIQGELGRMASGDFSEERLAAVRSHLRYRLLTMVDMPSSAAELFAQMAAAGGGIASLDEYSAALAAVTAEDVRAVATNFLGENNRLVVTLAERTDADGPRPDSRPLCAAGGAQ